MRAIEATEPHRSPLIQSGACRTSRRGQLALPTTLRTSYAPLAKHEHPLQPGSLSGVALRRTRRADGVGVDRSLPRDAVRALRSATTPTGPHRGRARGPRGCPRRPGARRWRAGIAWRPRVSFTVLGLVGELVGEAWQMPRRRRSGRCLRVDRCENPV